MTHVKLTPKAIQALLVSGQDLGRKDVKKFYVALPFSDDAYAADKVKDLARGVLDGVQGISETSEIIMQWYGMAREAVLVMDADKLVKLNKLSRVQYDNPEYLVSNGMAALYRIFDKKRDKSGRWGIAGNLIDHMRYGTKLSNNRGNEILAEAAALADQIEKNTVAVREALKALPFDKDDLRGAVRSVTNYQMDDDDIENFLKYRAEEAIKSLRAIAGYYDGLTKKTLIYFDGTEMSVNNDQAQAAEQAQQAEANAIDYGWTADQATALVDLMNAYAVVVKDFDQIAELEKKAKGEVANMHGDSTLFYALERGMRSILEEDFADHGTEDIRTVKGLAKRMHSVFSKANHWESKDIPLAGYERALRKALTSIGKTYSTEGEWLVKDKVLKVPEGSFLFVTKGTLPPDVAERRRSGTLTDLDKFLHKPDLDRADRVDRLIKENNLESRYKVRRIDDMKFNKARSLWHDKPKKVAAIKSSADNPKEFRLMFRLPSDTHPNLGSQLATGTLKGVSGITETGPVLQLRMFGVNRNAMLIMPGDQVLAANKLTPVRYDDPEALMRDDMKVAQRLMGASFTKERVIARILDRVRERGSSMRDWADKLSHHVLSPEEEMATKELSSVEEFATAWYEAAASILEETLANYSDAEKKFSEERFNSLLDKSNYVKATRAGLLGLGKQFFWEGEWIVDDKQLVIPKGSRLVLLKGKRFPEAKAIIEEHNLADRYKIQVADQGRMEKATLGLGKKVDTLEQRRKTIAKTLRSVADSLLS